jgi:glycosyltransferase involved in cell wall biosynthesis
MNKQPAVSVIVPVYKAESYLHRCVDSLLAQTFPDFEILLIDDGSPDHSGEICDAYAMRDSRVRVFHKENGGVSSARQCGIDNARGEYTIHTDPDDWVEPDMLEELYKKAKEEDADMVICDYYLEGLQRQYMNQRPSGLEGQIVLCDLMFQRLHGSLWNKLIRRACYRTYSVMLPKGLDYCEDVITLVQLWQNPIKITYVNKAFYYYDQHINEHSITRAYTKATYMMRCLYLDYLKKYLSEELYDKIYATQYSLVAQEAFFKNVFSNKEFYEMYHGSVHLFLRGRILWRNKFFLCASSIGLKSISYSIYMILSNIKSLFKRRTLSCIA